MVERLVRNEKVSGSNPLCSTTSDGAEFQIARDFATVGFDDQAVGVEMEDGKGVLVGAVEDGPEGDAMKSLALAVGTVVVVPAKVGADAAVA